MNGIWISLSLAADGATFQRVLPASGLQGSIQTIEPSIIESTRKRSAYWTYTWSALDIFSIQSNWQRADKTNDAGRRANAQAEGFRALLGLSQLWLQPVPFFNLKPNQTPTAEQITAQNAFANRGHDWKAHLPMMGVNLLLSAWVADKGERKYAKDTLVSGLFWGEVSLWSQKLVDTDWQWRISPNKIDATYRF